eukprot:4866090-Pleurochrysis_carterae.AAC.1
MPPFALSVCGTGWIIWRERKNLSEHVAISVSYLGGRADSFTLNFSRPASGVYVRTRALLPTRASVAHFCNVPSFSHTLPPLSSHTLNVSLLVYAQFAALRVGRVRVRGRGEN